MMTRMAFGHVNKSSSLKIRCPNPSFPCLHIAMPDCAAMLPPLAAYYMYCVLICRVQPRMLPYLTAASGIQPASQVSHQGDAFRHRGLEYSLSEKFRI